MPFTILGYAVKNSSFSFDVLSIKARVLVGIYLVLMGAGVSFMNYDTVFVVYVASGYGILPLFYISALFSTFGYMLLCSCVSSKVTEYIGRNTLPILLMHKFPILLFQLIFRIQLVKGGAVNIMISIGITLVSVAMSLAVGAFIDRFLPFMFGKKYRKK